MRDTGIAGSLSDDKTGPLNAESIGQPSFSSEPYPTLVGDVD